MIPRQFDIFLARIRFRKCNDIRPCIILYPPKSGTVTVAAISSQERLFAYAQHFWLEPSHPNFPTTALTRRSYIAVNQIDTIEIGELIAFVGRLEGELAREFKDWYGL